MAKSRELSRVPPFSPRRLTLAAYNVREALGARGRKRKWGEGFEARS
jgi:hypothetical protein